MAESNLNTKINFFKELECGQHNKKLTENDAIKRSSSKIKIPEIFVGNSENIKNEKNVFNKNNLTVQINNFSDDHLSKSTGNLHHLDVDNIITKSKSQETVQYEHQRSNSTEETSPELSHYKPINNLSADIDLTIKEDAKEDNNIYFKPRIHEVIPKKGMENIEIEFKKKADDMKFRRTNSLNLEHPEKKAEIIATENLYAKKLNEFKHKTKHENDVPRTFIFDFVHKVKKMSSSYNNLSTLQNAKLEKKDMYRSTEDLDKNEEIKIEIQKKPMKLENSRSNPELFAKKEELIEKHEEIKDEIQVVEENNFDIGNIKPTTEKIDENLDTPKDTISHSEKEDEDLENIKLTIKIEEPDPNHYTNTPLENEKISEDNNEEENKNNYKSDEFFLKLQRKEIHKSSENFQQNKKMLEDLFSGKKSKEQEDNETSESEPEEEIRTEIVTHSESQTMQNIYRDELISFIRNNSETSPPPSPKTTDYENTEPEEPIFDNTLENKQYRHLVQPRPQIESSKSDSTISPSPTPRARNISDDFPQPKPRTPEEIPEVILRRPRPAPRSTSMVLSDEDVFEEPKPIAAPRSRSNTLGDG